MFQKIILPTLFSGTILLGAYQMKSRLAVIINKAK